MMCPVFNNYSIAFFRLCTSRTFIKNVVQDLVCLLQLLHHITINHVWDFLFLLPAAIDFTSQFLVHTLSRISSTWPLGLVSVRSLVTLLNVDTQLSAPDLLSVFPVNSQMALLISSSLNVSAHSTKRCKDKTNFFNADPYRVSKTT